MSARKGSPAGIEARTRAGRTTYRAVAYDKRTARKLSKTFDTLAGARQWRADAIAAIGAGKLSADRGPTLRAAAEQWLRGARSGHVRNRSGDPYKPSAIRSYEANLRLRVLPDFGASRLGEIRPRDLQELVDRLAVAGAGASTITTTITPLRAIYRRAVNRGVVDRNPTHGLELPALRRGVRRFASREQAEALLAALGPSDRALWATALYAGLRRGELVALRWDDVDLAVGVIHVRRGWDSVEGEVAPKSRQGRRKVPVPGILRDYLLEHRTASGEELHVFGGDLPRVRRRAEVAAERWRDHGLEPITFHAARHSYASFMIAAGVNPKAVSTFMGHANIAITFDLYGHLMPGSEGEAAGALELYLAEQVVRAADPVLPRTSPKTSPEVAQTQG